MQASSVEVKVGLAPIISDDSRILILGSMPGDESIRLQQYYGHRQNHFWKILGEVFGETVPSVYEQRLAFLHARGIAVWDVLAAAERIGSSDSNIKNEVANDFTGFLAAHPGLQSIVFNGHKAEALFRRHEKSQAVATGTLRKLVFPSTSPLNMTPIGEKVLRWKPLATL